MKTHLLTALLVVVCTASAWAQSTTVYLPQIADGTEGGPAHWHTTIFIGNSGTTTASGSIAMTQSSGDPMTAQFVDELETARLEVVRLAFSSPRDRVTSTRQRPPNPSRLGSRRSQRTHR